MFTLIIKKSDGSEATMEVEKVRIHKIESDIPQFSIDTGAEEVPLEANVESVDVINAE